LSHNRLAPSIKDQLTAIKLELGSMLFYLISGLYILNALFMLWIPVNDFDTMSSYLARIKLEEFGPLKETATLSLQYLFPKFSDYLHAPFLKLGYLTTFPNFFLFSVVLFILVRQFPSKQAAWGLILLFFCPSVLMTISSAKNDITLGLLGFLTWYAITAFKQSPFYVAISLSLIAMLIGTKWHGVVLAAPLFLYLLWNLVSQKKFAGKKILIAVPFIPLYVIFSSLQVYITNYQDFGSFMPRPDYLQAVHFNIATNFLHLIMGLMADTIEPTLHLLQYIFHGSASTFANGFGKSAIPLLKGSSDFNSCGILLLLIVAASGIALFKKNIRIEIRVAALLCIFYFIVITCQFPYATVSNRYYLASYILGIVSAMTLLQHISPKHYSRLLMTLFLIFSSYAVLFNGERRLAPLAIRENGHTTRYHPIYKDLLDRDKLYFNVWSGYLNIFEFMQANIKPYNSLIIINFAEGGDVPFIYPLIKDRAAANTGIINIQNLHSPVLANSENINSNFVLTFRKPFNSNAYKLVYDYYNQGCKEVCIYRHI
jgi:hypothetical protein